jgi:hypothetical protein
MREGLGGVPSNFTVPFREEGASAGPAQLCNVQMSDNTISAHMGMNVHFDFDFIINLLSVR